MRRAGWWGVLLLLGSYAWQAYTYGPTHWGAMSVLVLVALVSLGLLFSEKP